MNVSTLTSQQLFISLDTVRPDLRLPLGSIIEARVGVRLGQNLFELLINNQTVRARTDQVFESGQQLRLAVERNDSSIILRSLTSPNQAVTESTAPEQLRIVRNEFLRQSLPAQASLQPLLKTLTQALNDNNGRLPSGNELSRVLSNFFGALTKPEKISSQEGLKQAVRRSGLFLEAQLANTPKTLTPQETVFDLKVGLLRLLAALKPIAEKATTQNPDYAKASLPSQTLSNTQTNQTATPSSNTITEQRSPQSTSLTTTQAGKSQVQNTPTVAGQNQLRNRTDTNSINQPSLSSVSELSPDTKKLIRQVEQSINRIQLQQNNAIAVEQSDLPFWSLDIPVKDDKEIDLLHLSIHRDNKSSKPEADASWCIELDFEFEGLGVMYARISLNAGKITATLWAEEEQTHKLLQSQLAELETQFSKAGLNIHSMQCLAGKPVEFRPNKTMQSLVDVHL